MPIDEALLERVGIELLRQDHDRESFSCGEPALDGSLRDSVPGGSPLSALKGQTWVVVPEPGARQVIAYYSVFPDPRDLIGDAGRLFASVEEIMLERLAVDREYQCKGIAPMLIQRVIDDTVAAAEVQPIEALILDPLNDSLGDYYLGLELGFFRLRADRPRLAVTIATMRALVAEE
jgi:GNAT superfamily N-acetyltransferase